MDVCKLEDFKESFQRLDELIGIEIGSSVNNEIIDTDPLIVKAIGGFALLYHELRYSGVTADVDSVTDIPDVYIKLIKRVGNEMNIPEDWLNDHSKSDMANIESKWEAVDWNLKHIKIFVLNVKSLIIDKIGWAEKNLSGASITDRDNTKDLNDFLEILWNMKIDYDSVDVLEKKMKETFEIDLKDYPGVRDYIERDLNDDGVYWPDGHV